MHTNWIIGKKKMMIWRIDQKWIKTGGKAKEAFEELAENGWKKKRKMVKIDGIESNWEDSRKGGKNENYMVAVGETEWRRNLIVNE